MKPLAVVIASTFYLLAFGYAYAHGDHPAMHGGTVGVGDDVIEVEFVMEDGTMNLYVHDETGAPLSIKNLKGTLTLIAPQRPAQEVKLVAAGEHKFKAPGIAPVRGDRMVARITLPTGEKTESAAYFSGVNLVKSGLSFSGGASTLPEGSRATGDKLP